VISRVCSNLTISAEKANVKSKILKKFKRFQKTLAKLEKTLCCVPKRLDFTLLTFKNLENKHTFLLLDYLSQNCAS
jgi:hypothetical protein